MLEIWKLVSYVGIKALEVVGGVALLTEEHVVARLLAEAVGAAVAAGAAPLSLPAAIESLMRLQAVLVVAVPTVATVEVAQPLDGVVALETFRLVKNVFFSDCAYLDGGLLSNC